MKAAPAAPAPTRAAHTLRWRRGQFRLTLALNRARQRHGRAHHTLSACYHAAMHSPMHGQAVAVMKVTERAAAPVAVMHEQAAAVVKVLSDQAVPTAMLLSDPA